MGLHRLCVLALLCLLVTSSSAGSNETQVSVLCGDGGSGSDIGELLPSSDAGYTSCYLPSASDMSHMPLSSTIPTGMLSPTSILVSDTTFSVISSAPNILSSHMPTATELPSMPSTVAGTSSTETETSTSLSGITLPLIIALAVLVFLCLFVLLLIICVTICKYCGWRKSGKPRKQPLYVVEVAEKGASDLELETTDLIEPDSLIPSGKKNDEPMCETSHAHLAATDHEAEMAKQNEQESAQKEEREFVTLETFGLPSIVTKELQGTATLDGGGPQLDIVKEQKGRSEEEGASEVATSRVEESTQQKTTTTQGERAADGEEQQSKPENEHGKTSMVKEEAPLLTHETGIITTTATAPENNTDAATKIAATTKIDAATKIAATTKIDAATKIAATTKTDAATKIASTTKTDAATKIDATAAINTQDSTQPANESTPASVKKDGNGVKGAVIPSSEPPQKQEVSTTAQDANREIVADRDSAATENTSSSKEVKDKQGSVEAEISGLDKEFARILEELEVTDL